MLISIECQDAVGTLDRIKVVASQGDLGEAAWEDNALAMVDESGKVRFVPHLDVLPKDLRGTAHEFVRFESPGPPAAPCRREQGVADKLRLLIYALLINDGIKPDRFTITIRTP